MAAVEETILLVSSLSNFFAFLLPIGHASPTPMAAVILFIAAGLFSPLSPAFFFFA
jgi:hypothetical protein